MKHTQLLKKEAALQEQLKDVWQNLAEVDEEIATRAAELAAELRKTAAEHAAAHATAKEAAARARSSAFWASCRTMPGYRSSETAPTTSAGQAGPEVNPSANATTPNRVDTQFYDSFETQIGANQETTQV